jgi:hypothetical protein
MNLDKAVGIGDTVDCHINGEPAHVTWRDAETLVIEPNDARRIVDITTDGKLRQFICADPDGTADFEIIDVFGNVRRTK